MNAKQRRKEVRELLRLFTVDKLVALRIQQTSGYEIWRSMPDRFSNRSRDEVCAKIMLKLRLLDK